MKAWAQALKLDVMTLYSAMRHPRTPWAARAFAAFVTAYALSPIDLIPDFIPVLGYLDDLLIVPVGVWLLLKMIPQDVLEECRAQSRKRLEQGLSRPRSPVGLVMVLLVWGLGAWVLWRFVFA
ncbi:MAG: YkvA family protein [Rubrivivax sp.]